MMRAAACLVSLALLVAPGQAGAQSLRDPTLPPAEAGMGGASASGSSLRIESGNTSVIVRDGRSYLVVGTRLYAQGQKVGQARIERISETEIWLREAGVLRKVPRFTGIERRAAAAPAVSAGCAPGASSKRETVKGARAAKVSKTSSSSNTSPAVAPCAGVRP